MATPVAPRDFYVDYGTDTETLTPHPLSSQPSYDFEDFEDFKEAVGPDLDPRTNPTFPKYHKLCMIVASLAIIRMGVLGFLSIPWAMKCIKEYPVGYEPGHLLYGIVDVESLIIPAELQDDKMIRYTYMCVFPIDLSIIFSTSCVGFFTRDIHWISFLCILWFCFMIISLLIYALGFVLFMINFRFLTLFYLDMILLPIIMVLLAFIIRFQRLWMHEGYKVFIQPYKVVTDETPDSKKLDSAKDDELRFGSAHSSRASSLLSTSDYSTTSRDSSKSGYIPPHPAADPKRNSYFEDPFKYPIVRPSVPLITSNAASLQPNRFSLGAARTGQVGDKNATRKMSSVREYDSDQKVTKADKYDRREDRRSSRAIIEDDSDRRNHGKSSIAREYEYDRGKDRKSSIASNKYDRRSSRAIIEDDSDRSNPGKLSIASSKYDRKMSIAREYEYDRKEGRRKSKSAEREKSKKKNSEKHRK